MTRSATQIIEEIQDHCYRSQGVDPESIRSLALEHVRQARSRASSDSDRTRLDKYHSRLQSLVAHPQLTRYQDPITILEILDAWTLIREANADEALEIVDPHTDPDLVVLATAPTGNLNAQAIQGSDGSKGIMFEVDLQAWAMVMSRLIEELLLTDKVNRMELRHPRDPQIFKGKQKILDRLVKVFVSTATSATVEAALDYFVPPRAQEEQDLYELIRMGFLSFVVGHELAHITRQHHNIEKRGKYWLPKDARDTLKKYFDIYEERYPGLTPQIVVDRLLKQGLELEADHYGRIYTYNTLKLHPATQLLMEDNDEAVDAPPHMHLIFVELGVLTFLWSMEYLERTVRTLHAGHDGMSLGILARDYAVQDIVCRTTHPCQMTRLHWLNTHFPHVGPVNDMLAVLFSKFWSYAYPQIQRQHREGARPHRKWIRADTDMARQLDLL